VTEILDGNLQDHHLPSQQRIWQNDGKEMVFVPEGEFLYGERKEIVNLPAFWIDKTPVTNVEFTHFVQDTGYQTTAEISGIGCANIHGKWEDITGANWRHPCGADLGDITGIPNHPVVQVSWEDAMAYARWAGKRLPTEEEWEKAGRGVDGREYPWGNGKPNKKLCNYDKHEGRTTPVGRFSPHGDSPYGCVDMSGNVWEWTSTAAAGGMVLRGGGWSHPAEYVRLILRSIHAPEERYDTDGFRCVSK
jgi:sulfatase modifying factor 1